MSQATMSQQEEDELGCANVDDGDDEDEDDEEPEQEEPETKKAKTRENSKKSSAKHYNKIKDSAIQALKQLWVLCVVEEIQPLEIAMFDHNDEEGSFSVSLTRLHNQS